MTELSRYCRGSGEVACLAPCLRGLGVATRPQTGGFQMAELSPAASSHDRGYDSPQSFCDDPTTLHPRRFQVQPIFDHFPDCLRLQDVRSFRCMWIPMRFPGPPSPRSFARCDSFVTLGSDAAPGVRTVMPLIRDVQRSVRRHQAHREFFGLYLQSA